MPATTSSCIFRRVVCAFAVLFPLVLAAQTATPAAPVIVGITPDTGLPNDGVTTARVFTVDGTADPNVSITLRVTQSSYVYGTASSDQWGFWRVSIDLGTNTPLGSLDFVAKAANAAGGVSVESNVYPVWIAYTITLNGMLARATVGTAVDAWINYSNSYPALSRVITVSGLPPGLACDAQGHITGTPTTAGIYRVAVTAGNGGSIDQKTYSLMVAPAGSTPPPPAPGGWASRDIGGVGVAGSTSISGTSATVKGSGSDIWDQADQFQFAYQPFSGDGVFVARLTSQTYTDYWGKAGVMIRDSLNPGAVNVFALRASGAGAAFQARQFVDGQTTWGSLGDTTLPVWLKIQRAGDIFSASESTDGSHWTVLGTARISLPANLYAGLAVTSHNNQALSTATFDSIANSTIASGDGTPSTGWSDADVGTTAIAGSSSVNSNTMTVAGSGADVWDTADGFHFVYRSVSGDCTVEAQVTSLTNTNAWAKAGVMIRASTAANAPNVFACVTPSNGISAQVRDTTGGSTLASNAWGLGVPYWVRLTRVGNEISAYISPDGAQWTLVNHFATTLGSSVLVGFAVTSHDNTRSATAIFTNPAIR